MKTFYAKCSNIKFYDLQRIISAIPLLYCLNTLIITNLFSNLLRELEVYFESKGWSTFMQIQFLRWFMKYKNK